MNNLDVDNLANFIRQLDGNHMMGAGALAEKIADWLQDTQPAANKAVEEGEPTDAELAQEVLLEDLEAIANYWDGTELKIYDGTEINVGKDLRERFSKLKFPSIAAARASRQVANKAEVEPVFYARQFDLDDPKWAAKHGVLVFGQKQEEGGAGGWTVPLYAALLASKGIEMSNPTIDTPEFRKLLTEYAEAMNDHWNRKKIEAARFALVSHIDATKVGASGESK